MGLLYERAADQAGYVSAAQAHDLGFSTARLQYQVDVGHLVRPRRGVLRFSRYPASDLEDYVIWWLWSGQAGVFSHETALMLHRLSDALPAKVHLTLPSSWAKRRLKVPGELLVHFEDVVKSERTWRDAIPITSVARALQECKRDGVSGELLSQAVREARERGLIDTRLARRLLRP